MYFTNPIKKFEARSSGLMSTHPPILDRINRLRAADRRGAAGDRPRRRAWPAWTEPVRAAVAGPSVDGPREARGILRPADGQPTGWLAIGPR